jgi:cysteine synthase A
MNLRTSHPDATDAYQLPRLVRLSPNLYGACFTLMKLIPARFILRRAEQSGELTPETVIVETTSGTFGLALAMQAVHMHRRLILVSDPVIDARLFRRLADLGAAVERVPAEAGNRTGGYQAARLDRLAEIRATQPDSYCPEQYSNPDNPRSYAAVSELLVEALGQVDCVVGTVGSGGSMCGTVGNLRTVLPECTAVGVDTHGSVLFGQPDRSRQLRGLGMSLLPANLDHRIFDQVHWCSASFAYQATRQLHQRHALFMGPTSGAAYLVARWWAQSNPDALTVVMFPDEGYRYLDTVYQDPWLAAEGHLDPPVPERPTGVGHPADSGDGWTTYHWGRRPYREVVPAGRGPVSPVAAP